MNEGREEKGGKEENFLLSREIISNFLVHSKWLVSSHRNMLLFDSCYFIIMLCFLSLLFLSPVFFLFLILGLLLNFLYSHTAKLTVFFLFTFLWILTCVLIHIATTIIKIQFHYPTKLPCSISLLLYPPTKLPKFGNH